jgi:transcriptional regulator with XRE-family HTH domain
MARSVREIVGERLVLLRRRKGWTQPKLAREAGMSITTLNRVENAHTSLTMEKVAALARVLGTSADYLLGLTDELHPSGRRRKAEKQGDFWPTAEARTGI